MHTLYHKRIPKTIPKDSIDGHGTSTGKKKSTLSFPSLRSATPKKATPTFCHCRPPQFAF